MSDAGPVTRLVPQPAATVPLRGLYLEHDLQRLAEAAGRPYVVANFVTSLDGRIAVARTDGTGLTVP